MSKKESASSREFVCVRACMHVCVCVCVCVCVFKFSVKTKSFDFFIPNLVKNGFMVGYSENKCRNVAIRISIPKIMYMPIFKQNKRLQFFGPKFARKLI